LVEIELNKEVDALIKNDAIQREIQHFESIGNQDKALELEEQLKNKYIIYKSKNNATATLLATWDPYDQNASSPFLDPEWMFDISDGFDVVIGNPPYLESKETTS
jgi:hypothetical protein